MQQRMSKRESCQDQSYLLGCALFCSFVILSISAGYYRHLFFWVVLGLVIAVYLAWVRVDSRRSGRQWQRRKATWENVSTQSFALPLDEAWQQLLPLIADQTLFSTEPASHTAENLAGYPASLRELFSHYDTICIEGLAIGTELPRFHRTEAFEYFTVPAPYRLIGYDTSFDSDGEAVVVKDTEETLHILDTFDEPDPGERYVCPSAVHYLLARARLVQEFSRGA